MNLSSDTRLSTQPSNFEATLGNYALGLFAGTTVAVGSAVFGGASGVGMTILEAFSNATEVTPYVANLTYYATMLGTAFMGVNNLTEINNHSIKQKAFSRGAVSSSAIAAAIATYNYF